MYVATVLFLALAIYQVVYEAKEGQLDRSNLCHSVYFLCTAFFNQLANCFFIYVGYKVLKTVKVYNAH